MEGKEICSFFMEGRCRFGERCRNYHPAGEVTHGDELSLTEKPGEENEVDSKEVSLMEKKISVGTKVKDVKSAKGKKPPMKTASDVISRIVWDSSLPAEHFVIGYLDRFLGVLEQPFSVFDWSDLAAAEHDALAIPQHRIQYFKYKGEKVWDKNERLDLIFGSTGASGCIAEVMDKVDSQVAAGSDAE